MDKRIFMSNPFDGKVKSGWNLPPGVFDNDPHFNDPEIDIDVDELNSHLKTVEDAIGAIDEAAHFAWENDLISRSEYDDVYDHTNDLYTSLESKLMALRNEGWNV
jgi:hypothetical protein